jgi:hypothetical protein
VEVVTATHLKMDHLKLENDTATMMLLLFKAVEKEEKTIEHHAMYLKFCSLPNR